MSYRCHQHGWAHLLNPCPTCSYYKASESTQYALVGLQKSHYDTLNAEIAALKAELYDKSEKIRKLKAAYKEMDRALFDIGSRAKHYMTPMEQDMKRVAVEAITMVQALLAASDETGCGCKVAGPGNVTITCPHGNLISSDEGKECFKCGGKGSDSLGSCFKCNGTGRVTS